MKTPTESQPGKCWHRDSSACHCKEKKYLELLRECAELQQRNHEYLSNLALSDSNSLERKLWEDNESLLARLSPILGKKA